MQLLIVLPSRDHAIIIGLAIVLLVLIGFALLFGARPLRLFRRQRATPYSPGLVTLPTGEAVEIRFGQVLVDRNILESYTRGANAVVIPRAFFGHATRPEISEDERTTAVNLGMWTWIALSKEIHDAGMAAAANQYFLPERRRRSTTS